MRRNIVQHERLWRTFLTSPGPQYILTARLGRDMRRQMKRLRYGSFAIFLTLITASASLAPAEQTENVFPSAGWPTAGWQACPPEEQGIDSAKLADGLAAIRERGLYLPSLMIGRTG